MENALMSKKTPKKVWGANPNFQGVALADVDVDACKPVNRSEMAAMLVAGEDYAVRVQPDAKQAELIKKYKKRVSNDANGAELFRLPKENKFAVMLKCEETGDINRVVRTSDLHQVRLGHEAAHEARKARRREARAAARAAKNAEANKA
jgi:hypothetical protein